MKFDYHEINSDRIDELQAVIQKSILSSFLALYRSGIQLEQIFIIKTRFDGLVSTGLSIIPMGKELCDPDKRKELLPLYDKMLDQFEREYSAIKEMLHDIRNAKQETND